MRATTRKSERGQAMAELAVCSIMFVSILTLGIHFGELQYISAKVHEADQHAMWDSTAYRVYNYATGVYDSSNAAAHVQNHTNGLYQYYAGLTSETGSFTTPPALVETKAAAPLAVTCTREGSMAFQGYLPVSSEPNGISCSALGQTSPLGFAAGGLKLGGGPAVLPATTSLCAVGKAIGGACDNNKTSILLGDFALAAPVGGSENMSCQLAGCSNSDFYNLTNTMWNAAPSTGYAPYGVYAENWAKGIDVPGIFGLGVPSGVENFYMSYRGEEYGFQETVPNGSSWETTPYHADPPGTAGSVYMQAYNSRTACQAANGYCFLGRDPCN